MTDIIRIKGAKTHNLKNISLDIPKNKFCVITGLSGSGKSSLAFDTLYAEGQRKYVESLSAYARQFLNIMDKPEVELIEGLSPAISIEQKSTSHNPRSTVGTITEIYDYLRILYARIGEAQCPTHHHPLKAQTLKEMTESITSLPEGSKIQILAPIVRNKKGEYKLLLENLAREGFTRVRIDGENYELSDPPELSLQIKHTIELTVDRIKVRHDDQTRVRLADSLATALKHADGLASVISMDQQFPPINFSAKYSCPECGYSIKELEPRCFSFNNPAGACEKCSGLGVLEVFEPRSFIVSSDLSLNDGAIAGWGPTNSFNFSVIKSVCAHYKIPLDKPFSTLTPEQQHILFYGNDSERIDMEMNFSHGGTWSHTTTFYGIIRSTERKYLEASESRREDYAKYLTRRTCPECNGARLNLAYRHVFVGGMSLPKLCQLPISEAQSFLQNLKLNNNEQQIASRLLKEINSRLQFLMDVGLDYLSLERSAEALSGGEAQRIRLASQIGSGLTGVMYVLDEPSIGLHQRDNDRLLKSLFHLRDLGNTVIVVEHDEDTMRAADYIIDIGPGAGVHGGEVVASGSLNDIMNCPNSLTGRFLKGVEKIAVPTSRQVAQNFLELKGASGNNLKNVDLKIPVGVLTCITGVSGSGKSTLINDTLYPAIHQALNKNVMDSPAPFQELNGVEYFNKVINIDQSPIGRLPSSNPATYTDLFTAIRELFAQTSEARSRGFTKGRFSFNNKEGRCPVCRGSGVIEVDMNFLPTVYVKCEECNGARYNQETLDISYKNKNIAEVLDMTVEEALAFFSAYPTIANKLQTLSDVGLGYIKLGQSAKTFSGGEAQRIKLAKELSARSTGRTLYILDEPTTGLHFKDVQMLISILMRLRDAGNTIVVIEHNLDVIKCADWIVDLGPEGGNRGGQIIAVGTPETISTTAGSYTGAFLKKILKS